MDSYLKNIAKFKSLSHLSKRFDTELKCFEFLEQKRWGGFISCPFCGSYLYSTTKTRFKNPELSKYKDFRCKACDKKYTTLTGTIFESTKIGLQIWFPAICLIYNNRDINSSRLSREIGVTQKTAWFMKRIIISQMPIRSKIKSKPNPIRENPVGFDNIYSQVIEWSKLDIFQISETELLKIHYDR